MIKSSSYIQGSQFSTPLLNWFREHGRHELPWQYQPTPYTVWISEIMLQQTQAKTVIPYFNRFIKRFPDIISLAESNIDEVLSLWAGLGYYARGRNLHQLAQIIHTEHDDQLPADKAKLLALPGIGESTSSAIMALAFGQRHVILDGNVKRVLSRFYVINGWPGRSAITRQLWQLAEKNTPTENVAEYTQAIMDLGAMVCTPSKPKCHNCPVAQDCIAKQQQLQHQYPTPRVKKKIPLRKIILLLLQKKSGEILLQRRPPVGVWGGLWCFPECPHNEDIKNWLLVATGFSGTIIKRMPVIIHTLTHFRMEISPVLMRIKKCHQIKETDDQRWYLSHDALKSGIPTPVKNILLTTMEK